MTAILVAALAVLVPLVLWHKVRGPAVVRGAAQLAMVLVAQAAAVVVVFVAVNNANGLYDNWGDLLGTESHVFAAPDLGVDGTGGRNTAAWAADKAGVHAGRRPRHGRGRPGHAPDGPGVRRGG